MTDTKPTNPKDAIGSDKLPLHLWPTTATAMGCLALLDGALKYGRANFRAVGVRPSIYVDAAQRHIAAWFEGEDNDPDSGLPHLGHALACLAILVDAQAAGKMNDDRQHPGGHRKLMDELTRHVPRVKAAHAHREPPKHYTLADALEDVIGPALAVRKATLAARTVNELRAGFGLPSLNVPVPPSEVTLSPGDRVRWVGPSDGRVTHGSVYTVHRVHEGWVSLCDIKGWGKPDHVEAAPPEDAFEPAEMRTFGPLPGASLENRKADALGKPATPHAFKPDCRVRYVGKGWHGLIPRAEYFVRAVFSDDTITLRGYVGPLPMADFEVVP